MATDKQIAANRHNAQKSTGPKSPEGKDRSKYNAVTHGLTGVNVVLPWENTEEFNDLYTMVMQELAPEGALEYKLAMRVVNHLWMMDRAAAYQTYTIEQSHYRDEMMKDLNTVSGYEYRIERSLYRTLRELRVCQKERALGRRIPMPDEAIFSGYLQKEGQPPPSTETLPGPCFPDIPLSPYARTPGLANRERRREAERAQAHLDDIALSLQAEPPSDTEVDDILHRGGHNQHPSYEPALAKTATPTNDTPSGRGAPSGANPGSKLGSFSQKTIDPEIDPSPSGSSAGDPGGRTPKLSDSV